MAFSNLFGDSNVHFAINLEFNRYIYAVCGNWDNYKPKNKSAVGNKEDKELEDIKELLDNVYTFYSMYN